MSIFVFKALWWVSVELFTSSHEPEGDEAFIHLWVQATYLLCRTVYGNAPFFFVGPFGWSPPHRLQLTDDAARADRINRLAFLAAIVRTQKRIVPRVALISPLISRTISTVIGQIVKQLGWLFPLLRSSPDLAHTTIESFDLGTNCRIMCQPSPNCVLCLEETRYFSKHKHAVTLQVALLATWTQSYTGMFRIKPLTLT